MASASDGLFLKVQTRPSAEPLGCSVGRDSGTGSQRRGPSLQAATQTKIYWLCWTGAPPVTHRDNGLMIPANLSTLQGHCVRQGLATCHRGIDGQA